MADKPDPDRLRDLDARIAKAKGVQMPAEKPETGKAFSQGEMAWRMVIELVSGMVIGLSIGYGLDYAFGTLPIFLVIFSLLGFVAGVRTMLGTAKAMGHEPKAGGNADGTEG